MRNSQTRTFLIQNTGLGMLHGKVVASGFGKTFRLLSGGGAFTLGDGEARVVNVKFTPALSTTFTGRITITSDDPANTSRLVTVSGTGM